MLPPREFIKKIKPFSFLSGSELDTIMSGLEVGLFRKGSTIYAKGQHRTHVYIIFSGLVGLFEEDEFPLDYFSRGEVFGILAAKGSPYSVTARAVEETICYLIPAEKFREVFEKNDRFSSFFASLVSRRFRSFRSIALDEDVPEEAVLVEEINRIVYKNPVTCTAETTVKEAVSRMDREGVSAIVIVDDDGHPTGIFTQRDLRKAVVEGNVSDAISRYMSCPVRSTDLRGTVFDALAGMMNAGIDHLVVTKEGRVFCIVTRNDLQSHLEPSVVSLFGRIGKATSTEELKHLYRNINKSVARLAAGGFNFYKLSKLITSVHDTIVTRVIETQMDASSGHAFAWLNMGSSGRKEQIIATDQDSALVHMGKDLQEPSEKIVEVLAGIGISKCRSGFMASNPQWNQSLSGWKDYFRNWFNDPVPNNVRYLSIFLDLRLIYGDRGIYQELTDWIKWNITSKAIRLLARDAVMIEPPLGIAGLLGLITGVDLKTYGIYPLVNGVRVLAIDNDMVQVTNTLERLEGLQGKGVLSEEMCHDLSEAYAFMQDLRLRHHSRSVLDRSEVDNRIRVKELSKVDLLVLKESLKVIASFQKFLMKKYDITQRTDSYFVSQIIGPRSTTDSLD